MYGFESSYDDGMMPRAFEAPSGLSGFGGRPSLHPAWRETERSIQHSRNAASRPHVERVQRRPARSTS
jgi:hypothetical protein